MVIFKNGNFWWIAILMKCNFDELYLWWFVILINCNYYFRAVKTGVFQLTEYYDSSEESNDASELKGLTDVFGQPISTSGNGPPALKKQPECICPNCQRNLAASRFAPHLEKCMGMGRNSSRLASRRYLNDLDWDI